MKVWTFFLMALLLPVVFLTFTACSDDNGTNSDDDNPNDTIPVDTIPNDTIPPDSTTLELVGQYPGLQTTVENGVAIKDNYMYLCNRWHILILDISDPSNPVQAGRYPEASDFSSYVTGLDIQGDMLGAFVMNGSRGMLHLMDISDRTVPTELSTLELERYNGNMKFSGDYAFICGADRGVFVVDVSDPENPSLVNTLSLSGGTGVASIHIDGDYLAASMTSIGVVRLLDISDPMTLDVANSFFTSGNPKTSFIYDDYLLIANGVFNPPSNAGGFLVYDVNSPIAASFIDSVANTSTISVYADNGYAYLTYAQTSGNNDLLRIFSIHDCETPVLLHEESLSYDGTFVISDGDYVYVATRNSLSVYEFKKF